MRLREDILEQVSLDKGQKIVKDLFPEGTPELRDQELDVAIFAILKTIADYLGVELWFPHQPEGSRYHIVDVYALPHGTTRGIKLGKVGVWIDTRGEEPIKYNLETTTLVSDPHDRTGVLPGPSARKEYQIFIKITGGKYVIYSWMDWDEGKYVVDEPQQMFTIPLFQTWLYYFFLPIQKKLNIAITFSSSPRRVSYQEYENAMQQQGELVGEFLRGELKKNTFLRRLRKCLKPINSAEVVVRNLDELCAVCGGRRGSEYAEQVRRHESAAYCRLSKYSARGLKLWFSYLETTDGKSIPFISCNITEVGRKWSEQDVRDFWKDALDIDSPSAGEKVILEAASEAPSIT